MARILPQLAVDINYNTARFPLWGFAKIDGVRAVHTEGFLSGRSMDPFKNTAINAKFAGPVYAGFDGEMTIDGLLTDETLDGATLCSLTTGLMNTSKLKKHCTALPDNAVWNLFDYLHPTVVHLPYAQRYTALASTLDHPCAPPHVRLLPFRVINNPEEASAFCDEMLDLGHEGAIFRDPNAMHKSGRATEKLNDFWRFKPVSDKDCIITGFEEAETNNNEKTTNSLGRSERSAHKDNKVGNGMVGTILAVDVLTGKPLRMGPGKMKHVDRIAAFNDPTLIVGHPAKYASLDTGVKDAPRQARFITLRPKADMTPADLVLVAELGL